MSEARELAERTVVTAMAMNPLVALDRSQMLAAAGRVAARSLVRPRALARRTGALARELGQIAVGTSKRAPPASDRRFADPTFRDHPFYRRLMQGYLAWREAILGLVDDADLDSKSRVRGHTALSLFIEAMAPTNTLVGNPAALKRALETGGASVLRGLRNFATDLRTNGGLPAQVDKRAFKVGENLACSPGQVVFRSEVLELIQYSPSTPTVHQRPLVIIPPQINKYYIPISPRAGAWSSSPSRKDSRSSPSAGGTRRRRSASGDSTRTSGRCAKPPTPAARSPAATRSTSSASAPAASPPPFSWGISQPAGMRASPQPPSR